MVCTSLRSSGNLDFSCIPIRASQVAEWVVKHLCLQMQETQVQFLGRKEPLEEDMETYSSILAWRIPWTEESRGLHIVHGIAKSWTWLSDCACVYTHTHECQFRWLFLRLRGQRLAMRVLGGSWGEGLELPELLPRLWFNGDCRLRESSSLLVSRKAMSRSVPCLS